MKSVSEQIRILKQGTEEILPEEELVRKLERSIRTGAPLRIKQGFDPTAPDIHLGHTVGLRKLRQFQELGHQIVLIVGDYTALVGDPSGRSETRPQLDYETVKSHAETYQAQFFRVIDPSRTEVRWNGEWFGKMTFRDMLDLTSRYTVARILERDDFTERMRAGRPVGVHELFYPIMQGYDSVMVKADVELGATEQKFNLLVGRATQAEYGMEPQIILTLPVLEGLDGVMRMSKSLGNYIGVAEPPGTMFGKVMSVPDTLIARYAALVTDLPAERVEAMRAGLLAKSLHPRDAKAEIAEAIVRMYHGTDHARAAREEFDRVFRDGKLPDEIVEHTVSCPPEGIRLVDVIASLGLASSKSDARRLVRQGAVTLDAARVADEECMLMPAGDVPALLRVGKLRFARIFLRNTGS